MATYRQLQRDAVTRDLFNNRITTMQGLDNAIKGSVSFLAIDTEHFPVTSEKDRILHQVGLAYLPALVQHDSNEVYTTSSISSQLRLHEFYDQNHVKGLTLNINLSKTQQNELVRVRGGRSIPARRLHHFGQEKQLDLEQLEGAVVEFTQGCDSKNNLVLIGFELAAEWTYLSRNFPQAIPFFSAWVDLRDMAKDIAPAGVIPGLVSLLQAIGYHWKDLQFKKPREEHSKHGVADNAGDDAVATCALAHALIFPGNHKKLQFRQECSQIATRKKGYHTPTTWDRFAAKAYTQGPLPSSTNSGMKLARYFFDYSPLSTGVMSEEAAYITFRTEDQRNQFVKSTHGLALPTGEVLLVEIYPRDNGAREQENVKREKKQKQRERKKLESTKGEIDGLESLFI